MLLISDGFAVQRKLPDGLCVRREILQIGLGDCTTEVLIRQCESRSRYDIRIPATERT